MLILHLCTDVDNLLKLKREVANLIENKIRAELEYRDSIFTTYAVVMARENLMLENMSKSDFRYFLDKVLDSEKEYHYVCLNPIVYIFLWLSLTNNKKDLRNLKIVRDNIEYLNPDEDLLRNVINNVSLYPYAFTKPSKIEEVDVDNPEENPIVDYKERGESLGITI